MAKRVPEVFQKISPEIMDDERIRKAGPMAEFLYIRSLLVMRQHLRDFTFLKKWFAEAADGIPNPKKQAQALVDVGLWIDEGDCWRIHNWEKWNLTEEERKAIADRRRAAGRRGGHKSKHSADHPDPDCEYCAEEGWLDESQANTQPNTQANA